MKFLGLIILLLLGALLALFRGLTLTGVDSIGFYIMVGTCLGTAGVVIHQSIKRN
jgi:hypothetical protein